MMNGGGSGLPEDQILIQEYLHERLTVESIAQKYSVPYSVAQKRIAYLKSKRSIPKNFAHGRFSDHERGVFVELYCQGKTVLEVSKICKVNKKTVIKALRQAGLSSRQKYAQAKPLDHEYLFTKRGRDSGALFHAARKFYGKNCMVCGWDKAPCDVRHIVPRAKGGLNSIPNVIVLCPNDHRMADRGIHCPKYLKKIQLDFIRHEGPIEWWFEAVGPHFRGKNFNGFEGL